MNKTDSRSSLRGQPSWRWILPPLLMVTAVGLLLMNVINPVGEEVSLDGDLCPLDENEITGSAMYLVDLRKPLDAALTSRPAKLLGDISLGMERNNEIQVFTLTNSESSPRMLLKRMCKPYDNADLQVDSAKDQRGTLRDCDDLPAQIPAETREFAAAFCSQRDALQKRLDLLADIRWTAEDRVDNAYLVEAIEDIRLEFVERPKPHVLYLFSDMMQHAKWYSHLDQEWTGWNYEDFADSLDSQTWVFRDQVNGDHVRVEIFYVPRIRWTDQPRAREIHQQFWRAHFAEGADEEIAFHDQPPMATYKVEPLMNILSEAEVATRERKATEQILLQIKEEQAALERAQRQRDLELARATEQLQRELERDRATGAERQQELERERVAAEERQQELERERVAAAERRQELERERVLAEERQPEMDSQRDRDGSRQLPDRETEPEMQSLPAVGQTTTVSNALPGGSEVAENQTLVEATQYCRLVIAANIQTRSPAYPRGGRMNFGTAEITVRYLVDEQGVTVDDEVVLLPDRSSAARQRYFDLFAEAALGTVRDWHFSFGETDDAECVRRQTRTTTFDFDYTYN